MSYDNDNNNNSGYGGSRNTDTFNTGGNDNNLGSRSDDHEYGRDKTNFSSDSNRGDTYGSSTGTGLGSGGYEEESGHAGRGTHGSGVAGGYEGSSERRRDDDFTSRNTGSSDNTYGSSTTGTTGAGYGSSTTDPSPYGSSGTGTTDSSYGTSTTRGGDQTGNYGSEGRHEDKPSMGEKIKGAAQGLLGKKDHKGEEGRERQTGEYGRDNNNDDY